MSFLDRENGLFQEEQYIPEITEEHKQVVINTLSRFELAELYIKNIMQDQPKSRFEYLMDQIKHIDPYTNQGEMLKKDMLRACRKLLGE